MSDLRNTFLSIISSDTFFFSSLSPFFPGTPTTHMLAFLKLFYKLSMSVSLFCHFFFLSFSQIALFPLSYLQVHWISLCVFPLNLGHVFLAFHQHIRLYLDILRVILKRFWNFFFFYIAVKSVEMFCVNKQFTQLGSNCSLSGPQWTMASVFIQFFKP